MSAIKRRGLKTFGYLNQMRKYYKADFRHLLVNIYSSCDHYGAHFTFPITIKPAMKRIDLLEDIKSTSNEIAVHGYSHMYYPDKSVGSILQDVDKSYQICLNELNIKPKTFRAPYNCYGEVGPYMFAYTFSHDIGLCRLNPFQEIYRSLKTSEVIDICRQNHIMFNPQRVYPKDMVFIPLNKWSDDKLIDTLHYTNEQITKILLDEIKKAETACGLIMFDLHPIRIGQDKYIKILDDLMHYVANTGGWMPNVSAAVQKRFKNRGCHYTVLFTGDIDQWRFSDYLWR